MVVVKMNHCISRRVVPGTWKHYINICSCFYHGENILHLRHVYKTITSVYKRRTFQQERLSLAL